MDSCHCDLFSFSGQRHCLVIGLRPGPTSWIWHGQRDTRSVLCGSWGMDSSCVPEEHPDASDNLFLPWSKMSISRLRNSLQESSYNISDKWILFSGFSFNKESIISKDRKFYKFLLVPEGGGDLITELIFSSCGAMVKNVTQWMENFAHIL